MSFDALVWPMIHECAHRQIQQVKGVIVKLTVALMSVQVLNSGKGGSTITTTIAARFVRFSAHYFQAVECEGSRNRKTGPLAAALNDKR
jgi:hypothetical protein